MLKSKSNTVLGTEDNLNEVCRKIIEIFLVICVYFISPAVSAQNIDSNEEPEETLEQRFLRTNILISEWLDESAEKIDRFLVSKRLSAEQNRTNLRLESTTYLSDGNDPSYSNTVQLNLRLPRVEKYFQLKFTNFDESEDRLTNQQTNLRNTARSQKYGARLGFFRQIGKVRTMFQPQIALQDPLKISHSLKFESTAQAGSVEVLPKFELFADPDKGTGFFVATNFRLPSGTRYTWNLINEGEYQDFINTLKVSNGVALEKKINRSTSYTYSLFFNSINRPSYNLESYSFAISRFQLIYKNILEYSMTPNLTFERLRQFKGYPGFTFSVALKF